MNEKQQHGTWYHNKNNKNVMYLKNIGQNWAQRKGRREKRRTKGVWYEFIYISIYFIHFTQLL